MSDFADLWPVKVRAPSPAMSVGQFTRQCEFDVVYRERDFIVAALAKLATLSGTTGGAWLARHEDTDGDEWDSDWRWVVYIGLPTGQVSWHIHDSELPLFAGLVRFVPAFGGNLAEIHFPDGRVQQRGYGLDSQFLWDGHTTEEKYRRLYAYVTG
jgi:hypothetical protein